jgi:hypothetical protein
MNGWALRHRRVSLRTLALAFAALLALAMLAVGNAPKANAIPSPDCSFSRSHFNHGWSTNFGGQIGVQTYRTYGDFYFWDHCDHGWISGTVAIFGRNLDNEDGTWQTRFQYRPDDSGAYRSTDLFFTKYHEEGGWTYYYVDTQHFINFSGDDGFVRNYRVGLRVIFDQDIRAQKLVQGNRGGGNWDTDFGNGF